MFFQWTKKLEMAQGRVQAVGWVIKKCYFGFPRFLLGCICCMRSGNIVHEQQSSAQSPI
jgi:hypothetical protein